MLSKLLYIVAIAGLGFGAFLSFQNRGKLVSARQEKGENNQVISAQIKKMESLKTEVDTEATSIKSAKATKEEKQVALEKAEKDKKSRDKELAEANQGITDSQAELKKVEDTVAQATQGIGSIDELSAQMEQLTKDIEVKNQEKATIEKEVALAKEAVAKNEEQIKALNTQASERKRAVALNSTEGTIIASNPDYGFAVVNIGQAKGVSADSKLIVMRGSQRIGTLTVTSVEANRTVGDIVQDSLEDSVAPGDSVIVEKVSK